MRVIIVDDEARARKALRQTILLYTPHLDIVGEAHSVPSAIEKIRNHQPDLVLLDVQLGDGNGFDVLNKTKPYSFQVIFITAYNQYAVKAFKVAAIDYILKPIDPEDFLTAIKKSQEQSYQEKLEERLDLFLQQVDSTPKVIKKISLKTLDSIHIINIKDIIYCQGEGNYTTFHLLNQEEIIVSKNLREYETLLPSQLFLRTHQSFLVNSEHILRYDKRDNQGLVCSQNHHIPVSIRKKEAVLEFLKKLY
ncbi:MULTISPECIES: LytTR family DNA-binding domain-containing protein [unclassified Aureispira]|uniref:LytR/AlgR family response regulator transcription factor n=1 Tax=unclassified Aureispira TaxID=2649989 RepID=UPI0006968CD7|nr:MULTISPECIES: LytTR family DNA-binding domain-containing protein [unclassified Aureispira]WMX14582.1 LytTR family DNA-binding domain-containing protein [Aureispira sp. CCB-E]